MRAGKQAAGSCSSAHEQASEVDESLVALAARLEREEQEQTHQSEMATLLMERDSLLRANSEQALFRLLAERPAAACKSAPGTLVLGALKDIVKDVEVSDLVRRPSGSVGSSDEANMTSFALAVAARAARDSTSVGALLRSLRCPAAGLSGHQSAVAAASAFVSTLSEPDEMVLGSWAVFSLNEWSRVDDRVLVLTSRALYRVRERPDDQGPALSHCAPLAGITEVQTGARGCFVLAQREQDGRANPVQFSMRKLRGWSNSTRAEGFVRTFERKYEPTVPKGVSAELVRDLLVAAVRAAKACSEAKECSAPTCSELAYIEPPLQCGCVVAPAA